MAVASGGVAAVASLATGGVAQAQQTFTVTNLNDSGAGSLRQAILNVNADTTDLAAPGDSIVFTNGLSGTIALSTADPTNTDDSLYIQRPVQIAGPGANQLTIKADPDHRVLGTHPTSGVTDMAVKLSGLTLTGGSGVSAGAGVDADETSLEIDAMAVTDTTSTYVPAVDVFNPGSTLTMNDSTVSGNMATSPGGTGGVYSEYGGVINNSTITGNSGGVGAGASAYGGILIINGSTVAGNTPTVSDAGQVLQDNGTLNIDDSIVSGSGAVPDVTLENGATGFASFSLIRNAAAPSGDTAVTTDATDILGKDPELGMLGFNGGPTETMVPAATSPVLDQGKSFGLTTDQRGLPRPFVLPTITSVPAGGDHSDIGSVEVETPAVGLVAPSSGSAGTHVGIAGVGFNGATEVLFGSKPATSFTVLNDTAIAAVAPVGAGTEDIRVITPLGESKVATADHFAFPSFKPTVSKPHAKRSGSKVSTGIKVSCPSGGLSCSGTYKATATVKHHKTKLAGGSISLSAGGSKTISFKLGSKALKQLKSAGKLKITIQFVVADGSQTPIKVNRTITLKYKHKKH